MSHPFRPQDPDHGITEPSGLYRTRLSPEDRAAFDAATGDSDISDDIRLIRAVLAHFIVDIPKNIRIIIWLAAVLLRAVAIRDKQAGHESEVQAALAEAAERVLQSHREDEV